MARRSTGDGDEYTEPEIDDLADWIDEEIGSDGGGVSGLTVTAQVEWSGTVENNGRNGVRTTRLDSLNLRKTADAVREKRRTVGRSRGGRPYESLRAKSWHSQLAYLTKTQSGQAAADRAGLSPSATTLRRWLSEEQAPSKANQARIDRAYSGLRNRPVTASRDVVNAFTDDLRARYGSTIRLRDVTRFEK